MVEQSEVWIVASKRTVQGKFQGKLAQYSAPQLGSAAIVGAIESISLKLDQVDEVYMGCVLTAGCGQAPARQAALGAKLSQSIPCTTIGKVCGSGMKAVMLAHDQIRLGAARCIIAGGMESMTNAPYLLKNARAGMRMGHQQTHDHMFLDGLQDAYEGELMGVFGQRMADKLKFTRQEMDEWAQSSTLRAREAQCQRLFEDELVTLETKHGAVECDELPPSVNLEKLAKLRPAFAEGGTITAANSSAISDGAAVHVLLNSHYAKQLGYAPLAIIRGHASHARSPDEFTLAPVFAIESLLSRLDWTIDDVDLWEINEAFAVVAQIAMKQLELDKDKVNIKGGACALGHPIGASGARILVTLIHSLRQLQKVHGNKRVLRGIAALCIGGGEATAIAVEVPLTDE